MSNWLLKTEPSTYSYADLARDQVTTWDGVKNPAALNNIRSMKNGDQAFIYHTGDEKAIVGVMKATGDAYPDPVDRSGKLYAVDVAPVEKLGRAVTLAEIKADGRFTEFPLTRISRLSVMPVNAAEWKAIEGLSRKG